MSAPYAVEMVEIATRLWGTPNATLSTRKEKRFGNSGSKSIDLGKAVFFDHETNTGGGYRDLYKLANGQFPENGNGHDKTDFRPPAGMIRELGMPIAWWDYRDENGDILVRVVRFEPPGAIKAYRQCRPVDQGWKWSTKGIQIPLYHLPELLKAEAGSTVHITEGEKCADALIAWGLLATTNAGGAKKFQEHHAKTLAVFRCAILPDNDKAGASHHGEVMRQLRDAGCKELRTLHLPNLPEKGDVVDWIKAGGTLADFEALAARVWQDDPQPSQDEEDARIEAASSAAVESVVDRFNAKFMVVNEGGKAVIYQPGYDPVLKRRHFDRLQPRDLMTLYLNDLVQTGFDEKQRPVYKCVADVWLRHPRRRQHVDGVVFDPRNQSPPGVLNLWAGFAVEPVAGDWSLLKDHIRTNICCEDPILYEYLVGWIARMLQSPAEQGEVAVVLKGLKGTGKGTLAKVLLRITGHHGLREPLVRTTARVAGSVTRLSARCRRESTILIDLLK